MTNNGTGATDVPQWNDGVWLSTDAAFDGSDVFLGSASNPSFLDVGESYRNSLTATLPNGINGDFFLSWLRTASIKCLSSKTRATTPASEGRRM